MQHLKNLILLTIICFFSCKNESSFKKKENIHASSCVQKIMEIDEKAGTIRNHACETASLSEAVKSYVSKLGNLDFKNCPEDFKNAFNAHKNAWSDVLPITDLYPDLRGEMHILFEEIEKGDHGTEFKLLVKKLWDTWAEVEIHIKK